MGSSLILTFTHSIITKVIAVKIIFVFSKLLIIINNINRIFCPFQSRIIFIFIKYNRVKLPVIFKVIPHKFFWIYAVFLKYSLTIQIELTLITFYFFSCLFLYLSTFSIRVFTTLMV